MPLGNLPKEARDLWERVYQRYLDEGLSEEEAAKRAWGAVKQAGWRQDMEGNWHKRAEVESFSLIITKASYDKSSGEMRWKAVASDTDEDLYNDNMTLELFNDFIKRIEEKEEVPEEFRSDFWSGGMPYLSISHYPDLNGWAVPGTVDAVYIDGNRLKAKGTFFDTELGRACFRAVCDDLYNKGQGDKDNKVRISIAFLDYKHQHKDSGTIFERKSIDESCTECLVNRLKGEVGNKIFLRGQLIHLAMTRVPVNPRTPVEVDRAMTTRKEDAASIVGEELAEQLDEEAKKVGKSLAVVIKSEEELSNTEEPEEEVTASVEELAAMKKERDCEHPAGHYLVVEDKDKPSTWHLRVRNCDGELDHRLMGAAWAALHSGYRGNKYEGPHKKQAIAKLKKLYASEGLETPKADLLSWFSGVAEEFKAFVGEENLQDLADVISFVAQSLGSYKESHPLDKSIEELKSAFDAQLASGKSEEEVLRALQEPYGKLGREIQRYVSSQSAPVGKIDSPTQNEALLQVIEKLNLITERLDRMSVRSTEEVPPRRQLDPRLVMEQSNIVRSSTPKLRAIIERTTR